MKVLLFLASLLFTCNIFALEGLKRGSLAPVEVVKDVESRSFNLKNNKGPLVLVFYRGSWCPYCLKQLKSLQKDVLPKTKAPVLAISVDKKSTVLKMKKRFGFKLHLVSDPKARLLKSFNIINKLDKKLVSKYKSAYGIDIEGDSGEKHHMIAHPAVFIIKNGKIIFSEVHIDYKQRTSNQKILSNL